MYGKTSRIHARDAKHMTKPCIHGKRVDETAAYIIANLTRTQVIFERKRGGTNGMGVFGIVLFIFVKKILFLFLRHKSAMATGWHMSPAVPG